MGLRRSVINEIESESERVFDLADLREKVVHTLSNFELKKTLYFVFQTRLFSNLVKVFFN